MRKEVQSQVREFREVLKADHCLLVPESYIMQNWDKVTMSALFFTAIVTPFEVSFLETEAGSFLFWINQVSVRGQDGARRFRTFPFDPPPLVVAHTTIATSSTSDLPYPHPGSPRLRS